MLVDTNCGTSLFRDDPDSSDEDIAPKVDGLVALEFFLVFVLRIRVGVRVRMRVRFNCFLFHVYNSFVVSFSF